MATTTEHGQDQSMTNGTEGLSQPLNTSTDPAPPPSAIDTPKNMGGSGGDDDDDPVIHEIPVFLAKSLASNLHLFQYPVRPAHMSYDTSTVLSARVRPEQLQVELSIALDTHSKNYDQSKGEQIALNVDGCGSSRQQQQSPEEKTFSSGVMDQQVLTSSKVPTPQISRYAVGILGSNELHITPLQSVLSLRPDLTYLDKSDKTARAEGRTLPNDDPDDPSAAADAADAEEEVKAVTVKFAKSDVESARKYREKTYDYMQKKKEEEPWVPMRFHHVKSQRWEDESQRMFCKKMDEEIACLSAKPGQYLDTLVNQEAK